MFIQNYILLFIISIFIGISFGYSFSLNYFFTCILSFFILFISFFITDVFSEKRFIKLKIGLYIPGLLLSVVFLILFKIPFFPFLLLQEVYYYSRGRKIYEKKISSEEVGKLSAIFLGILLIFSIIGIFFKNFLLVVLPSVLIFSLLIPYSNSFGSALFFYNFFYFAFFFIISVIFIFIGFSFLLLS